MSRESPGDDRGSLDLRAIVPLTGRRRLHSASAAWRTSFLCATLEGAANHALSDGQRMTNEGACLAPLGRGACVVSGGKLGYVAFEENETGRGLPASKPEGQGYTVQAPPT